MKQHDPIQTVRQLVELYSGRDLNEADTRHRIVDEIIHTVFSWPKNGVGCERYINDGFIDYVLYNESGKAALIVEAKKDGIYFELPHYLEDKCSLSSIGKIKSNDKIKAALEQARQYCFDIGCPFGCITNGNEWIFFKAFQDGTRWDDLGCFIVPGLNFFEESYAVLYNDFSYTSIVNENSLYKLFGKGKHPILTRFGVFENIIDSDHPIINNRLAPYLRSISKAFFDKLEPAEHDFMEKCYVMPSQAGKSFDGFSSLLQDRLTPFFKKFRIEELRPDKSGGQLGYALERKIFYHYSGDVIIIFGGKGAGKSTFIRKFFYHSPPEFIINQSKVALIDLISVPEEKEIIRTHIWKQLCLQLDTECLLDGDRDILKDLFSDRYEVSLRQDLAGLDKDSLDYNKKLNSLLHKWKNDRKYLASKLYSKHKANGKESIVILDNTDQYPNLQDFCFTIAQEIAAEIGCICIISMREERFYSSNIKGVLDAFHNRGFHLSSPNLRDVFLRRVNFVIDIIRASPDSISLDNDNDKNDVLRFYLILQQAFDNQNSHLNRFMIACSRGNVRHALDIFHEFLLSGYLNVDEMLRIEGIWTIQNHQVIKPMMTPDRFYYNEALSKIPNLYQLRGIDTSSHFSAMRILKFLYNDFSLRAITYIPIAKIRRYFIDVFDQNSDFELNLAILLNHGLIESSNRMDDFSSSIDSIKISAYGVYFLRTLMHNFTYLDLITHDCRFHSESIANTMARFANEDLQMFFERNPLKRIQHRLSKVEIFLNYLQQEEEREVVEYGLADFYENLIPKVIEMFSLKKIAILSSAERRYGC